MLDHLHASYCLEPAFSCWGEHERWAAEMAATAAYHRARTAACTAISIVVFLLLLALAAGSFGANGRVDEPRDAAARLGGLARAMASAAARYVGVWRRRIKDEGRVV